MKEIVLCFLMVIPFTLSSQDHINPYQINEQGKLFLSKIIENPKLSKDNFFHRSKSWIAKAFIDGKEVEIYSDKEKGEIIGKGAIKVKNVLGSLNGSSSYLDFTITIISKKGKARIVLDQITYRQTSTKSVPGVPKTKLERYYWKKGDTNKKAKSKVTKHKQKMLEHLQFTINSWSEEIELDNSNYSDF
jgi:hypothetical protein